MSPETVSQLDIKWTFLSSKSLDRATKSSRKPVIFIFFRLLEISLTFWSNFCCCCWARSGAQSRAASPSSSPSAWSPSAQSTSTSALQSLTSQSFSSSEVTTIETSTNLETTLLFWPFLLFAKTNLTNGNIESNVFVFGVPCLIISFTSNFQGIESKCVRFSCSCKVLFNDEVNFVKPEPMVFV